MEKPLPKKRRPQGALPITKPDAYRNLVVKGLRQGLSLEEAKKRANEQLGTHYA
ncbi:MAG: hypothetical protein QXD98_02970 [Candidatus Diapherotrites archaeon]